MSYADQNQFLADYLPEVKLPAEKAAIGRILESVSRFVDSYCKRPSGYFNPSPQEPFVKRLRGEGVAFLRMPRHVPGSIIDINGEAWEALSARIYESEKNGWLYFETEEFGNENSFSGCAREFVENRVYKVTARWGFEVTPQDVVQAVCLIANRIWSTERGTIGQITPEGFVQDRLIPAAARDLLKPYIRREFEI